MFGAIYPLQSFRRYFELTRDSTPVGKGGARREGLALRRRNCEKSWLTRVHCHRNPMIVKTRLAGSETGKDISAGPFVRKQAHFNVENHVLTSLRA